MGLTNMVAEGKALEMAPDETKQKTECGLCPNDKTQTIKDDNTGYCYCPKCKQMYSPSGTL
jgi:Zn finger protein HypA/HybF involved in hydrogenase expression